MCEVVFEKRANGTVFSYFQCSDRVWENEPDPRIEFERNEFLKRHDPNRIDTRNVRKEFKEPFIENLGLNVNRIPDERTSCIGKI